ncbi:MAG: hypothetical protein WC755_05725 [Candidatus Woesearchaeota archaeon]|jgi:hypothetical protein
MLDVIVNGIDENFFRIAILTFTLVVSGLLIYFMYSRLSNKDLFSIPLAKKDDTKFKKFLLSAGYTLKYVLIFPVYIFIWYVLLVLILIVLTKSANPENTLFFAIILVSAIRVASYIKEDFACDLAKLLPLTMIATIVSTPEFLSLDLKSIVETFNLTGSSSLITLFPSFAKYLFFTLFLEWILRAINILILRIKEK